jgi:biotin transport system substrate-specific component
MIDARTNVLADCLPGSLSIRRDILWVVGFSLLTALLAQIAIPLPFTAVPITGQTFAVLMSGAVLGSRRGFLCQALYLAEGAFGLPFFAPVGGASVLHLLGPTAGYLWTYPVAAGIVGWLAEKGASRAIWKLALALILGDSLILLGGAGWLEAIYHFSPQNAWRLGIFPFLIGDFFKITLVGLTLPNVLKRYNRGSTPSGRQ